MSEKTAGKLLLSASEAAGLLSISRSMFYQLLSAGRIPAPVRLGRRALWRKAELESWTAAGCPAREIWMRQCKGTDL